MSQKLKVLVLENSVDITGAFKSITSAAYSLKDNFDFHFIIPDNSKVKTTLQEHGFNDITEFKLIEISKSINSLLLYVPFLSFNLLKLRRLLKRENISIIHSNDLYNLLPAIYTFFGGTVPYVCHVRFLPDKFPRLLIKLWMYFHCKHARKIIAVSASVAQQLPNHKKIVVIHDVLPISELYPQYVRSIEGKKVFLYLANYIPGKGQQFALEAFSKVQSQLPDWILKFVGSDMGLIKNKLYKEVLRSRSKQLLLEDKIVWSEFTKDVEMEYKNADVILNFSESESFSITCLEALFFGKPIVASDCGGPREIIDDGTTGILVENKQVDKMARAMLTIASDPDRMIMMGENGKKSVRVKFGHKKTSLLIQEIYNQLF